MDSDSEDDSAIDSKDVRETLLEIARNRPATNVAKAITAYHESPTINLLITEVEEVSKNTDFSTDMRFSINYYLGEFSRYTSDPNVSRRTVLASAANMLQYLGKIWSDRVEMVYQLVEHQVITLINADPNKDSNADGNNEANKPVEPRKRRTKKLIQKEFDPFTYRMEPKSFRQMSDEKRFSYSGFESNKNRHRTMEHMYQDHINEFLWKYSPIVDPDNPNEIDWKKNYKLFTYHIEPRYNTLVPDIPFHRLNLIQKYINTHRPVTNIHENMTNQEYLNEFISLENQMLAARYGDRITEKRMHDGSGGQPTKRIRLTVEENDVREDQQAKRIHLTADENEGSEDQQAKRLRLTSNENDGDIETDENELLQTETFVESALGDSLSQLTLAETSEVLNDSQISSTVEMNDSNCLHSTRLDIPLSEGKQDSQQQLKLSLSVDNSCNAEQLLQIDSGIVMDLSTGQSFDDEGVVLADNIDEQLPQSLSPKVMVQDIFPGVPDKANLSVHVDAEMLALSGIRDTLEEIVDIPREVHFSIERNLFKLPEKRLRRHCFFNLPKDFELFKKARAPAKRQAERKAPAMTKVLPNVSPTHSVSSLDLYPELPPDQLEFDFELNFLGFHRRPTYDSGIDQEELIRADSTYLQADDSFTDVDDEVTPNIENATDIAQELDEIQQARAHGNSIDEVLLGASASNLTSANDDNLSEDPALAEQDTSLKMMPNEASGSDSTMAAKDTSFEMMSIEASGNDPALAEEDTSFEMMSNEASGATATEVTVEKDNKAGERAMNNTKTYDSIDEETDAMIADWHRRLAPVLEASHERQNFNIHDLNDEVIRACEEGNGKATLEDVLKDKDPTRLCCYMLSTLILTNQENVAINVDKRNKDRPIELSELKIELLSTERRQIHPEDEIGGAYCPNQPNKDLENVQSTSKGFRRRVLEPRSDDAIEPINVKTVRLIEPVPKASARPEDADSGISSLPCSLMSAFSNGT